MRRGHDFRKILLIIIFIVLSCLWLIGKYQLAIAYENPFEQSVKIRATCYVGNGITASGKETRPGIMAGKPEWIGCVACVNAVNEDGSIGEFIGYYEILDTGYGAETGVGQSKIFSNRTLGTIEVGQTVDIWFPTTHQAEEWIDTYGDYVYVKIIDGEG